MRYIPPKLFERGRKPKYFFDNTPTSYVLYLEWMVATYGARAVERMQEPPITFKEWEKARNLAHHTTK